MLGDPIGYFLTWVTYGTWLPGDPRGWIEYRAGWQLPDPIREREAAALMTEGVCVLNIEQRRRDMRSSRLDPPCSQLPLEQHSRRRDGGRQAPEEDPR